MRPENEEAMRRFAEAMESRDFPDDLFAPGFLMINPSQPMFDNVYHGRAGARQWMVDLVDTFADSWHASYEIVADGSGWFVAKLRVEGTGSTSGAPLQLAWAALIQVRDGRWAKAEGFLRVRDALAAAGVTDEPAA